MRLTFDTRRGCWVLLAPERLLLPDEVAVEVLRRCTGRASLDEIVDDLSRAFEGDRDEIARDQIFLRRLAAYEVRGDRLYLRW